MSDFMRGLLDVCFYLFSQTSNVVVFVPTMCLFFCGCFALIRRLMSRK